MNLNKFTIKAQEVVQHAQQLAFDNKNQSIETAHLLKSLLDNDEEVLDYLLKKTGANINLISTRTDAIISKLPKVEGGEAYLSQAANQALMKAQSVTKDFKDEFVSVEHILIGLLSGKDEVANVLKDAGLTDKNLRSAITELRAGSTVNSQNA